MNNLRIEIKENELWWCGVIDFAELMPFGRNSVFECDVRHNMTYNQCNPMLISNKGRYIWCEEYFSVKVKGAIIDISSDGKIEFSDGVGTLKSAFKACSTAHFPPSGSYPDELHFVRPQYCTWIALMYNQNEEGIEGYADSIVKAGYPVGEFIIDAGWQEDYGVLGFHAGRFPSPKAMFERLNKLGFETALWIVPYVSPDSEVFRFAEKRGYLIKTADGGSCIGHWWDGYSAMVDFSNVEAVEWFYGMLDKLKDDYGICGFKWDGGDSRIYPDGMVTRMNTAPNEQSRCYAMSSIKYKINEIRACCKCGGQPIVSRIADRRHCWDKKGGIGGIISKAVTMGLSGYPYLCPDMIGGGQYDDFMGVDSAKLDEELMIRYCQAAALMPMMQFSYPLWNLSERAAAVGRECARLHMQYADYIMDLARNAAKNGEPIMRGMDYQFGISGANEQFMLGDRVLVAPVIEKGKTEKRVILPDGEWQYVPNGKIYGGGTHTVSAPIDVLPYFIRA